MADDYTIQVEHEGRSFSAGVRADEELDQLLVRSLHHFELDPKNKDDWTLVRAPRERRAEEEGLTLRETVANQLENGERVRLLPRGVDREEPATGSY